MSRHDGLLHDILEGRVFMLEKNKRKKDTVVR